MATDGRRLQIDVLGPIRARAAGRDVTPDGPLQRRLLALLVLHRGAPVSADAAVDALWPGGPPRDPAAALQTHLYRLRRSLPEDVIESTAVGYRLDPLLVDLDADRLTRAVHAAGDGDPDALAEIEARLAAWRGPAYPELADDDDGRAEAARMEELRANAAEARADALLRAGATDGLVAEVATLVEAHPLRERPRSLLMEALAATGRRVEALRAYDDFRRLLADELGIDPSPVLAAQHGRLLAGELRDDDETGTGPDGPGDDHDGLTAWSPPNRLPAPVTSLVGRDELVAEALALVDRHRLVTLLGTGGVGKTRLLLELGRQLRGRRPDRPVVLCELAPVTTPAISGDTAAVDAVATALAVEGRPGVGLVERLVGALRETEVVLLLDNCEHVLDPIAALAEALLGDCPGVRIVTTTRERLRIAGEQLCPVPPLSLASEDAPAESLFVERAGSVVAGFEPDAEERAVIAELVRRLDGIPLAIELAAARLHTMSVTEVLAGLDRRFRMLAAGSRTSDRHRSMGAAVEWSVAALDDPLRRVFTEVSTFAAAFTLDDAAAVCAAYRDDVGDALTELTERSLVMRAAGGRYLVLETLRAYGLEQLEQDGRLGETRDRHARHWIEWTEALDRLAAHPGGGDAFCRIDDALPELRAALVWLLDRRAPEGREEQVALAGRLVVALQHYGFLRLRPDVLAWAERVLAADPDDSSPFAASIHAISGLAAWMAGDVADYAARIERARRCAVPGAPNPIITTGEGSVALFAGRLEDAIATYRRLVDEADGDPSFTAIGRCCVVLALGYAGHPDAASEAEALLADAGDSQSVFAAYAWYSAGEADLGGDIDRARTRYERAIELAERSGAAFVTGVAGTSKASIEARYGDAAVAAAEYRELLLLWRRGGMWSTQWTMLRSVAFLLDRMGRHREAAVLVGAVRATSSGHRIFGADELALTELEVRLRRALGDDAYTAAAAEGAALDDDDAVEHALQSL